MSSKTYFDFLPSHWNSRRQIKFDTRTFPPRRSQFFKLGAVFNHYQHSMGNKVLFWSQLQSQLGKRAISLKTKTLQKSEDIPDGFFSCII